MRAEAIDRFGAGINPAADQLEKHESLPGRVEKMLAMIRAKFHGPLVLAGGFDRETATRWLEAGKVELVAFGRASVTSRARERMSDDDGDRVESLPSGVNEEVTPHASGLSPSPRRSGVCVHRRWPE